MFAAKPSNSLAVASIIVSVGTDTIPISRIPETVPASSTASGGAWVLTSIPDRPVLGPVGDTVVKSAAEHLHDVLVALGEDAPVHR